jgi:hypothetical protein
MWKPGPAYPATGAAPNASPNDFFVRLGWGRGAADWRLPFDCLTEASDFDGGLMGFAERLL